LASPQPAGLDRLPSSYAPLHGEGEERDLALKIEASPGAYLHNCNCRLI
jgi:hypothetical protein